MESPNNESISVQNQLIDLGCLLKDKKKILEATKLQITGIKEEIREIMTTNDIKKIEDDLVNIKITRSYAFDVGSFKLEEPEVSKNFIKEETTTKIKDVVDKKSLKKLLPATYQRFLVELSPRLRVT